MNRSARLWLDLDGCWSDFERYVRDTFGVHCNDPAAHMGPVWEAIVADPAHWERLPLMPDAKDALSLVWPYQPWILSGGAGNMADCQVAKARWAAKHMGEMPVFVVERKRKPEFCRPGDVLIDDNEENCQLWEDVGGIAILHRSWESTAAKLAAHGLTPESMDLGTAPLIQQKREVYGSRRGYSAYEISEGDRSRLMDLFPLPISEKAPVRFQPVCHHVTRAFPALDDLPPSPRAELAAWGEILDHESGHHILLVKVDGEKLRADGRHYHITLALDDSEAAVKARGDKPKAWESNIAIEKAIAVHGEDVLSAAFSKPGLFFRCEYRLYEQLKQARAPKIGRPEATETVEPIVFPSGQTGERVTRIQGDVMTVITRTEAGKPYSEGDSPSIIRVNTLSGDVIWHNGPAEVQLPGLK